MAFRLFVDSSTGLTVDPTYDYKEKAKKIEDRHRTRDGSEFVYRYGGYNSFTVPVTFVSSSFKAIVNSWWDSNVDLKWMEEGTATVYDVRIMNKTQPVDSFIKPYSDQFRGVIELSTY